jgi:hypothetical protein
MQQEANPSNDNLKSCTKPKPLLFPRADETLPRPPLIPSYSDPTVY